MDGYEVHSVFSVSANNVQEVLSRNTNKRFFQVADGIVHGHRTDHGGAHVDKLLAEIVRFAVIGKDHDAFRAQLDSSTHLFEFHFGVHQVARNTQINVYLGTHAFAYALGAQSDMVYVGGNGNAALRNTYTNLFGRFMLLGGNCFHLRRDFARTGIIDLSDETFLRHHGSLRWHYPYRFYGSGPCPLSAKQPRIAGG